MSNLILPEDKKVIAMEYKRRSWVILASLGIVLFSISLILLFSLGVLIEARLVSLRSATTSDAKRAAAMEVAEYEKAAKETRELMTIFNQPTLPAPSLLINQILKYKPTNITLTTITYAYPQPKVLSLTLSGTAATRKSLISFIELLNKDKTFVSVDSPLSNLVKEVNAPFTISVMIKQ